MFRVPHDCPPLPACRPLHILVLRPSLGLHWLEVDSGQRPVQHRLKTPHGRSWPGSASSMGAAVPCWLSRSVYRASPFPHTGSPARVSLRFAEQSPLHTLRAILSTCCAALLSRMVGVPRSTRSPAIARLPAVASLLFAAISWEALPRVRLIPSQHRASIDSKPLMAEVAGILRILHMWSTGAGLLCTKAGPASATFVGVRPNVARPRPNLARSRPWDFGPTLAKVGAESATSAQTRPKLIRIRQGSSSSRQFRRLLSD